MSIHCDFTRKRAQRRKGNKSEHTNIMWTQNVSKKKLNMQTNWSVLVHDQHSRNHIPIDRAANACGISWCVEFIGGILIIIV